MNEVDADELLHLAVFDSQNGNHEEAISKLKRSLSLRPKDANATFMLAAEHAELGMIDRAIEEMTKAIQLEPKLAIAHFQLGLLYLLYQNDPVRARQAWLSLDSLTGAEAMVSFKSGLLCLADDNFDEALKKLDQGLTQNTSNNSLNREMTKIRNRIRELASGAKPDKKADDEQKVSNQLLMSTYRNPPEGESR